MKGPAVKSVAVGASFVSKTMAASTRSQVISLYRMMLRESSKFPSYNYRTYAVRRVRDAFRANRKIGDPKAVEGLMEEGRQTLALIQRQVSIGKMYETQKIVVE
ncbi:LYR motif-containing protein 4 [Mugil cephalus]|uniref:LYR motif-containing protein 4 n=1 Tax=Mugil cephalus TaxID=48193 RepID=UPI001FB6FFCC|nr:LYR motif-containing protein 4 [Mugil cephalus]